MPKIFINRKKLAWLAMDEFMAHAENRDFDILRLLHSRMMTKKKYY